MIMHVEAVPHGAFSFEVPSQRSGMNGVLPVLSARNPQMKAEYLGGGSNRHLRTTTHSSTTYMQYPNGKYRSYR